MKKVAISADAQGLGAGLLRWIPRSLANAHSVPRILWRQEGWIQRRQVSGRASRLRARAISAQVEAESRQLVGGATAGVDIIAGSGPRLLDAPRWAHPSGEQDLTHWMCAHRGLRVWEPRGLEKGRLAAVERKVIDGLHPPLNLTYGLATPEAKRLRAHIRSARSAMAARAHG